MNYDTFRYNLRSLINNSGKLMKDISVDINIAPASLSRYLSGQREPDLEYVVRLAQYFGVSVDWLLGITSRKFDPLPPEIMEIAELYAYASNDDRRVVKVILDKYRDKTYSEKTEEI